MSEQTINQRLRFLVEKLAPSTRAFSEALGESSGNTQNYIGARQIEPKYEYLAKVLRHFSIVNANWLMTGEGEPFLHSISEDSLPTTNAQKIFHSQVVGTNNGPNNQQQHNGSAKQATELKNQLALAEKEIQSLRMQVEMQAALLAAKEETITLLRGSYRNPN